MQKLINSRFSWLYLLVWCHFTEYNCFACECPLRHDKRKKVYTHKAGEKYAGSHTRTGKY